MGYSGAVEDAMAKSGAERLVTDGMTCRVGPPASGLRRTRWLRTPVTPMFEEQILT